jgi:anaerobic selenocysteine-containing dehydrogenase
LSDELPPMATRRTAPALPNRQTDVPPCPATNRQADGFGKVRLMLTGSPWHTHNGELTRRTALLMLQNCDPLEISPEDAVIFGLVDGGSAVVGSDNGKIIVPVVVSGTLQPGWVRLSNYFSQTCAQVLWGSEDTMSTPLPVTLRPCGPADDPDKMLTDDQIAYVKLQRYRTDDVPEPSPV